MPYRILLAEDHTIVRQCLRSHLNREGFEVVAEAGDGREAVKLVEQFHPDVAVLDLAMPSLNGLDAAREILRISPRTKVILLTMYTEGHYVVDALRSGVKGYVLKNQVVTDLHQAIQEVSKGGVYLSPRITQPVVDAYLGRKDYSPEPLTPREREVLQLIAEGKTTKEVAGVLGISVKTAESHRTRIMQKLNIHDTANLVRYAIRRGIVRA